MSCLLLRRSASGPERYRNLPGLPSCPPKRKQVSFQCNRLPTEFLSFLGLLIPIHSSHPAATPCPEYSCFCTRGWGSNGFFPHAFLLVSHSLSSLYLSSNKCSSREPHLHHNLNELENIAMMECTWSI